MKDVILFFGGVLFVNVILCELMVVINIIVLKILGVSFLNNIKFENDGICVWRVYDIGLGKFIFRSKLNFLLLLNVLFIIVILV